MSETKAKAAARASAAAAEETQAAAATAAQAAQEAQEAAAAEPEPGLSAEEAPEDTGPALVPAPNGTADDPEGSMLPGQFEAGRLYDVQLLKPIIIGNRTLPPGDSQTITAELCQENRDKLWRAVLNDSGVQEVR